jgi:hypothetical protein
MRQKPSAQDPQLAQELAEAAYVALAVVVAVACQHRQVVVAAVAAGVGEQAKGLAAFPAMQGLARHL